MRISSSSSVLLATLAFSTSSTTLAAPVEHPAAFPSSSSLRSVAMARADDSMHMHVNAGEQPRLRTEAEYTPGAHVDRHGRRQLLSGLEPTLGPLLGPVDGLVGSLVPGLGDTLDGVFRGLGLLSPEKPSAHAGAVVDAADGPQAAVDNSATDADSEVDPALAAQFQDALDQAQQQLEDAAAERSFVVERDTQADGVTTPTPPAFPVNPPNTPIRGLNPLLPRGLSRFGRIARDTPPLFSDLKADMDSGSSSTSGKGQTY
ncbi:hypothetical protein C8Q80DRAFT_26920 [Daedaleopsis nitida]|nr:hypothetical protein C8Q80DRAFT_26920 [Daedaleopsis nitida]